MEQAHRRLAFLRVLIGAAWADGELGSSEIRALSYYLHRFRIDQREYEQLRPLLEEPLSQAAAHRLVEEQLELLTDEEERQTLVAAVEDLLTADNKLTAQETEFLRHLRALTNDIATAPVFIARLRALWESTPALPELPELSSPRQAGVEHFLRRRLLEYVRGRIALARAREGLPEAEGVSDRDLYRAVIWAGLLGQVAQADQRFCPAEKDQLISVLSAGSDLPRADLEVIAGTCFDGSLSEVNLAVLVREFTQVCSSQDSSMLLDGLFLVAAADGVLHEAEVAVIREIAQAAGLSEQAFGASLHRCQQRLTAGWN